MIWIPQLFSSLKGKIQAWLKNPSKMLKCLLLIRTNRTDIRLKSFTTAKTAWLKSQYKIKIILKS